jgi:hypothetical protein
MEKNFKYAPDARVVWTKRLSVALHIVLPAAALFTFRGASPHLIPHFIFGAAYLGYFVFAIVLHKEFFPESLRAAAKLLGVPLLFGAVAALLAGDLARTPAWCGVLLFTGLEAAVALVFSAGSRLAAVDAFAAPGESRLEWRTAGVSLWSDPNLAPMTRWAIVLVFFLPGVFALGGFHLAMWRQVGELHCWRAGLLILWWIASLLWTARLFVYQLVGLTAEGRIFGPGKQSFS